MPECENVITAIECESEPSSKSFSMDDTINSIYQSAINLTMSLHYNNNFSRKDVTNIQKEFSNHLIRIKPIADLLISFVNYKIKDTLLLSSFHTLISAISTPFKLCTFEYILNK